MGVSGRIQTKSYEAKDGTRRYVTEVIAEEVQFLEWGNNNGGNNRANNNNSEFGAGGDFGSDSFDMDMTPVDDGDIPF